MSLLDTVKEAWEEQPTPFCSLIDYIQEMQDWVMAIVHMHMRTAQREQ